MAQKHLALQQDTKHSTEGTRRNGDGKCVTVTTVTLFACLTKHRAMKTWAGNGVHGLLPSVGDWLHAERVTLNGVSQGSAFTVLSNGLHVPLNTTCANIWGRGSRVPRNFYFSTRRGVSRHSSVGIATRYGLDGPGIESRWG